MSTYRAFEVTGRRDFRLVQRELTEPQPGEVRVRVEACGVCHTDAFVAEGMRADRSKPIVPGHEIVGVIDAVGAGVHAWLLGDRVGIGYLNGHCGECEQCRRGDFVNCTDQNQTGTTVDGGYSEVAYGRASGLVRVPEGVDPLAAAPLLCAGLTVYRALLTANARPGSLVAVQGIGGWAILVSNMPKRWVIGSRPLPAVPEKQILQCNSVLTSTSTASRSILPRRYESWAVRPPSSRRRPAGPRCRH